MKHVRMRSRLQVAYIVLLAITTFALWGCGGSGGTSGGGSAATSVRVVFPGQQASLERGGIPDGAPPQPRNHQTAIANLLDDLKGLYEVQLAYAQTVPGVPANVASLLLIVTGADMSPIQANIDISTGRVTVPVPVGNDRLFEVRAFPAGSSIPNFIGRTTANVSPNGTNVTVNMQTANLQPPIVTHPGDQSTQEGQTVSLQIVASDPNGLSLTCSASSLPPGLGIDPAQCLISGTLPFTAAGTYSVTVSASDDILTTSITFTWTVIDVPQQPVVNNPGDRNNQEGDTVSLQISATDFTGNPLTFSATNLPPELTINSSTGLISGTLPLTSAGTYAVTVTASNGTQAGSTAFTWMVENFSLPPVVINPGPQNSQEGQTVALQIMASDPDGDPLAFSATTLPPALSIDPATGLIRGMLTRTSAGTYAVRVTASDGTLSNSATFTWLISNPSPIANAGPDQTVFVEQTVTLDGNASRDPDGDPLTFQWSFTSIPTSSRATLSSPTAARPTFVVDLPGSYVVQLIVNDGTANSVPDSVTVTSNLFSPRFAYVSNSGDNTVSTYIVDATTGQLRHHGYALTGAFPLSVTVDPSGRFAYVANRDSNDVSAYTVNVTTGTLTPIAMAPFTAGTAPSEVRVDPSSRFAYVTNLGDSQSPSNVSAYTIDPTSGALTPIAGSPFAAGISPQSIIVDPSGRFVYVTNAGSNNISGYTINNLTGVLTPIAGSPFAAGAFPWAITVEPTGRFAYVTNGDSNDVSAYTINTSTGALTPIGSPFPTGTTPFGATVDPSGQFVYVANQGSDDISGYTINAATGALTQIAGSPFPAGDGPFWVRVDPSGRFAYATGITSGGISSYSLDAMSGALTPIGTIQARVSPTDMVISRGTAAVTVMPRFAYVASDISTAISPFSINSTTGVLTPIGPPIATAGIAQSVAVDPSSRFLYAANQGSNNIVPFSIVTSGALAPLGAPVPSGPDPRAVAVDPSGRFLYVANFGNVEVEEFGDISAFTIDATTGVLTPVVEDGVAVTVAAGTSPAALAFDPSGRFLYVANFGNEDFEDFGDISMFSINATTGVITSIRIGGEVVGVAAGLNPAALAVEPSGRFLYVANQGSNDISMFTVDATTGVLTPVVEEDGVAVTVAAGVNPAALAVEPSGRFLYVANFGDPVEGLIGNLSAFTIDATTGALTPLGGPVSAGANPRALAVDPSGRFLYVASQDSSNVSVFTIDATTGILAAVGLPVPAAPRPVSLAISGMVQ